MHPSSPPHLQPYLASGRPNPFVTYSEPTPTHPPRHNLGNDAIISSTVPFSAQPFVLPSASNTADDLNSVMVMPIHLLGAHAEVRDAGVLFANMANNKRISARELGALVSEALKRDNNNEQTEQRVERAVNYVMDVCTNNDAQSKLLFRSYVPVKQIIESLRPFFQKFFESLFDDKPRTQRRQFWCGEIKFGVSCDKNKIAISYVPKGKGYLEDLIDVPVTWPKANVQSSTKRSADANLEKDEDVKRSRLNNELTKERVETTTTISTVSNSPMSHETEESEEHFWNIEMDKLISSTLSNSASTLSNWDMGSLLEDDANIGYLF